MGAEFWVVISGIPLPPEVPLIFGNLHMSIGPTLEYWHNSTRQILVLTFLVSVGVRYRCQRLSLLMLSSTCQLIHSLRAQVLRSFVRYLNGDYTGMCCMAPILWIISSLEVAPVF